MTIFRMGQRVRTTVDAPSVWPGGFSGLPEGPHVGYGVRLDGDASGLPAAYDPDELTAA
ncbi:hypothetical protein [Streptomyces sp. H27-D2]|uniref:hypothetical protein n=1 Tax=Streptomyces sp. H27-D2 TaxID=3046304 RepID=UPI002DBD2059|nr:hypothetical protein [Streptomyces sp. H27-D2]MEC4016045.1 hypothetical protein [Streptomyces sp. H27-D2]